jgi:lipoprotein NlpI
LNPKFTKAYVFRGLARDRLKNYDDALTDFNKAIELDAQRAPSFVDRGWTKIALADFDGAVSDGNKAIEINTNDDNAYMMRGAAKRLQNDFKEAVSDFNQALQMDPKNVPALSLRGLTKENLKNQNGALADCSKAVELDPQNATAFESLGIVQNDLGQFQPAMENFRKAVQLDPLLEHPRMRIWLIRARFGEQENATKELTEYLNSLQGAQKNDWPAKIGQFLTGALNEEDFLNLAKTSARNPKQQSGQLCQANYYAGMKHFLASDKEGATALFKKCLGTGEKGYTEYVSAGMELNALK